MAGGRLALGLILKLLSDESRVRLLLHEGGLALFGDLVAHGYIDELFLTVLRSSAAGILSGKDVLA
jgi:riboflavin biosynthesis pyrimidine reductase